MDSATALALALERGFAAHCLTIQYGQRHMSEIRSAREIVAQFAVSQHEIVSLDLSQFGGSALTDDIPVPKDTPSEALQAGIPVTYVPARNTIFLSLALAWAETLAAFDIFIGVNALDYSGYPDCRPEFVAAFEQLARLATKVGVTQERRIEIHAPLIHMSKAEIIRTGVRLGVDYAVTTSCYDPDPEGRACGHCDACMLRRKGFAEAAVPDPTVYQAA